MLRKMLKMGMMNGGLKSPWYLSGGITKSSCVASYKAKGATNLVTSLINLVSPGDFNLVSDTLPTWNSTDGWIFNGDDGTYLDTGIIPVTVGQVWSMLARFSNAKLETSTSQVVGKPSEGGIGRFYIAPNRTTYGVLYANGDMESKTPGMTNGVLAIAGNKGYRNGNLDATIATADGTSTLPIKIGYVDWDDWPGYTGNVQAVAIYNTILSGAQILAVSNAMINL
jgi:hypothetical protein